MPASDQTILLERLRNEWGFHLDRSELSPKVTRYIDQFFDRERVGQKIIARIQGNHGIYTVTINAAAPHLISTCTCYIGSGGGCHHCSALARTFLNAPESFAEIVPKTFDEVHTLADLPDYLNYITLAELIDRLKEAGITQKAFAEAVGTTSNTITGLKSSEARHTKRYELGSLKLAALWVLETFGE